MPADPSPITSDPSTFGQVNLTWGSVSGVTGYRVYRKRTSVAGASYVLILDTTDLSYSDVIAAYDLDTLGTVSGEEWKYKVTAYDATSESSGLETTCTMKAQLSTDITAATINHTPYNDGSDQTASYTISNPDALTPVVADDTKILHEGRMRLIDAYGRHTSN
jgi:fibronectin type 3 domain-containing protein